MGHKKGYVFFEKGAPKGVGYYRIDVVAAAAEVAAPSGPEFIAGGCDAESYMGHKEGYVFFENGGPRGVGYYRIDVVPPHLMPDLIPEADRLSLSDTPTATAGPPTGFANAPPTAAPPAVGGKEGALLQAAMARDASLAAGVSRAMGGPGT